MGKLQTPGIRVQHMFCMLNTLLIPADFHTPDLFAGNKCAPAVLVLRDSGTVNWQDGSVFDIQDMCCTLIPGTRLFLG